MKTLLIATDLSIRNQYPYLLAHAYERNGQRVEAGSKNFWETKTPPDILHIQWPEALYRWSYPLSIDHQLITEFSDRFIWYKSRGTQIVYTAHNLEPHQPLHADLEARIFELVYKFADRVVHHGHASIEILTRKYSHLPKKIHVYAPHGSYPTEQYPAEKALARYRIPDNRTTLLNFGAQRASKGTDFITQVHSYLDQDKWHLFTIGPRTPTKPTRAHRRYNRLIAFLNNRAMGRVRSLQGKTVIWRDVPDNEIPAIFAASDIMLLGHNKGLNSGMLALAGSYGLPVVYPDMGNFREQLDGWPLQSSYTPNDLGSAIKALEKVNALLSMAKEQPHLLNNSSWLTTHSWELHIQKVMESLAISTL